MIFLLLPTRPHADSHTKAPKGLNSSSLERSGGKRMSYLALSVLSLFFCLVPFGVRSIGMIVGKKQNYIHRIYRKRMFLSVFKNFQGVEVATGSSMDRAPAGRRRRERGNDGDIRRGRERPRDREA